MIESHTLDAPAPAVTKPVIKTLTGKKLNLPLHRFLDTSLHLLHAWQDYLPVPIVMLGSNLVAGVAWAKIFPANETIIAGAIGSGLIATAAGLYEATCPENNSRRTRLTHGYNHNRISIEAPRRAPQHMVLTSAFMAATLLADVTGATKNISQGVRDFTDSAKKYMVTIRETTGQSTNIPHYGQFLRHTAP